MRLSLSQSVFLGNKVHIGFQVDTLIFQVHCSSLYHHSSDTGSGSMSGWRLVYIHYGIASPKLLHFPMLPSSSGTPPFLRTFSLTSTISTLVMVHVSGIVMSVRVHEAACFTGIPGWVGLIDWSCCSQEDISREGMDSGCLNCVGKNVSFMASCTVFRSDPCFHIISWMCACSCLICHKENTKSHLGM